MPRTAKTPKPDRLAELRLEARRVLLAALDLEAEQATPEAAYRSQELFYGAMQLSREDAVIKRCIKALRINPNNPDPMLLLARFVGGSPNEQIALHERIVLAGERDLGKKNIEIFKGHFWGFVETRPYMRALHTLARLYEKAGQLSKAVQIYEQMLKLNPNDNQGVRYALLGHYLALNKLGDARKLWNRYDQEHSAFWAWGKVLLEFLAGNLEAAQEALGVARKVNPHAESYLGGWKPLPKELPGFYSPGQDSEAIYCFVELGAAWVKNPHAQRWLEQH
ncbi:tetratricopeptide repeat protein [Meiothermus ruber]|jgi:tetratricopeptide (TPR) repeat protein|uniref:tetratricopeptide repeat protein n=1 Tax=Meiothermus ruber TaxID=277 RepID=UPI00055DADFB|nr:tetratricopeptide repeat protein [Meiothermus ruber]MCL6531165.1 tetratricopeptide repeat protein [Meiothermus ruber]